MILFSEGKVVSRLQEAALSQLEAHITCQDKPKTRFPRLLLMLSNLSSLSPNTIEDLFFSGIIGNIKIQSVIPYILQMEQGTECSSPLHQSLVPSPPPSPDSDHPTTSSSATIEVSAASPVPSLEVASSSNMSEPTESIKEGDGGNEMEEGSNNTSSEHIDPID